MKRVLAFGCHPDDIEFMAAGTLALLAEKGNEVHLATMTGGEVGSPTLKIGEIRDKRLKEAAASAGLIGAAYHYAGGHDLEVDHIQVTGVTGEFLGVMPCSILARSASTRALRAAGRSSTGEAR